MRDKPGLSKTMSQTQFDNGYWYVTELKTFAAELGKLNQSKRGPLRTEHGRYINFVSDFMAANRNATREQMLKAWKELKKMDAPKTYESWAERRGQPRSA